MDAKLGRRVRARILGLAASIALVAMFLPALAGVALGHHAAIVVLQIDCNGNVNYDVQDWQQGSGATFDIYYETDGGAFTLLTHAGAFTGANGWDYKGAFFVGSSVSSVQVEATNFVWADGDKADKGPYTSTTAYRPAGGCSNPTIATTLSATLPVAMGTSVFDTATLTGTSVDAQRKSNAGGTVTYTVYTDNACSKNAQSAGTVTVTNGVVPKSNSLTFTNAGTYYWQAVYSGDANNTAATSVCGSEVLVVNQVSPTITTTLSATTPVTVGTQVHDRATLTGATATAGGTVTYTVYSDKTCQTWFAGAGTKTVTNGGVPNSSNVTFNTAGTYYWQAVYSGDANNAAATSACGSELLFVGKQTPAITTQAGGTVVIGSGSELKDNATLSGGYNPTGSITFKLYDPTTPTGLLRDTETVTIHGDGTYAVPTGFTPDMVGTWYWVASYGGDQYNKSVASGATEEPVVVSPATPAVTTTPTPAGPIALSSGLKLTDSAILSGGYKPTGTITFKLYDATSPTNALRDTMTVTVHGDGTYTTPTGFTPDMVGTWHWIVTYASGDGNNLNATGTNDESVVVTAGTPAVTTTPGGTVVLGSGAKLTDTAHLTGGFNPTGTITFVLTNPNGKVMDTEGVAVNNGDGYYAAPGYVPDMAGTWHWDVTYNGDGNNVKATGTNDESVVVSPATPAVATNPGGTVVLGSGAALTDTATLSGGYNPTGTITFTLTDPNGTIKHTETVNVDKGDGTYTTQTGFVPDMAGTWNWVAVYSGDSNNVSVAGKMGDEPVTIDKLTPAVTTNPGGTVVLGSGDKLTDTAHLTGGFNPTGTITFVLTDPNGVIKDTETVTVNNGDGYYQAPGFVPDMAGTWHWDVTYTSGDGNNVDATGSNDESVVVSPATPAVTTTPGGTVVLGSGAALTDTATLSGGVNPTGTITFKLYDATSPTGLLRDTETTPANGDGTYPTPTGFVPDMAGTWHWDVTFTSGDGNNVDATGANDENVVVSPASPAITTVTGGSVVLGSAKKLTDTATLSGGYNPTGTITFTLTDPTNALRDTETAAVNGNGDYPTPTGFTPDMAGTWHWVASYGGDSNNNPVASGKTDEPVEVTPAGPAITTKLSEADGTVGDSVNDTATLSGFTANAGGTVTYTVYSDNACSTKFADAGTVTVTNGAVPNSSAITFNDAGTYYWQAVYSGDANNTAVTSACTDEVLVIGYSHVEGATATPTEAVEGATGTPVRVATPPVTSTDGSSPSGDSMPLFALLICLFFIGTGVVAVQAQRRTMRP